MKRTAVLLAMLLMLCSAGTAQVKGRVTSRGSGGWTGLPGVTVRLFQGSRMLARAQTNGDGQYVLEAEAAAACRLDVLLPMDMFFAEETPVRPVQEDAREGWTEPFDIPAEGLEIGEIRSVPAASVSGWAWEDADADGLPEDGEGALAGVYAVLLSMDGDPEVVSSAQVSLEGTYAFDRLRPGTYALAFRMPEGALFTAAGMPGGSCAFTEGAGGTALSAVFALTEGEKRKGMNVGGFAPARAGDFVWMDQNGNGLQDYGEPGCAGVRLLLLDEQGNPLAETVSDAYGYYAFRGLRPGVRRIRALPPEDAAFTAGPSEGLEEIDSDADPGTGETRPFRLLPGEDRRNLDFGIAALSGE